MKSNLIPSATKTSISGVFDQRMPANAPLKSGLITQNRQAQKRSSWNRNGTSYIKKKSFLNRGARKIDDELMASIYRIFFCAA
jgi:hypothetical protein